MESSVPGLFDNFKLKPNSEPDDSDVVERSPNNRYVRYGEILGKGAFKTGFDEVDGIEIAWNQVSIEDALQSPENLERLYSEVHLLRTLKHENIIKSYISWVNDENKTINMITELFTSGNLRQYRRKHKSVEMKAIKSWARQILLGLNYLHCQNPPIIHRDLKCDNIFVNGNHGEVKIGDLGFATIMQQPTARSVIGTPEFMAPELYEEEYNELVDIYSFGMCILELITCEYPYSECKNQAQIYKKVISGIKPAALGKVKDPQVKHFIEKCLLPQAQRLPSAELLRDPFLSSDTSKELMRDHMKLPSLMPKSVNLPKPSSLPMEIDANLNKVSSSTCTKSTTETPHLSYLEFQRFNERNDFRLRGEKIDDNSISLTLRIADLCGRIRNIHFVFYLLADTAFTIAGEMVEQLDLLNEDVAFIAELIDSLVLVLVPSWKPSLGSYSGVNSSYDNGRGVIEEQALVNPVTENLNELSAKFNFTSASNDIDLKTLGSIDCLIDESSKGLKEYGSDRSKGSVGDSAISSECTKGSGISCITVSNDLSLYLVSKDNEKEKCYELKLELDAIDRQYQQCCRELSRMREEAIENAKRKWCTKKKIPAF
ncbi:hypothetical protein RJ639_016369 [Escallonia herrerae]|uniref:non-specific serine/threonine protein kinase n=1 Tax=Escallonia herrerae TaxID=1293975 RepID=A0AA88VE46_9ASTE|nr:hypothetical protein RJ639_016369 [Escallonia herrerae]